MEVRVNKDIKEYKENMFFGLTLRQFIFSVLGCAVAVVLYFALKTIPSLLANFLFP